MRLGGGHWQRIRPFRLSQPQSLHHPPDQIADLPRVFTVCGCLQLTWYVFDSYSSQSQVLVNVLARSALGCFASTRPQPPRLYEIGLTPQEQSYIVNALRLEDCDLALSLLHYCPHCFLPRASTSWQSRCNHFLSSSTRNHLSLRITSPRSSLQWDRYRCLHRRACANLASPSLARCQIMSDCDTINTKSLSVSTC